jgi:hypothetical protein
VGQGYYGNEGATAAAFRAGAGWFDTGDLGWIAPDGVPGSRMAGTVVLTGRSKDTIVLSRCFVRAFALRPRRAWQESVCHLVAVHSTAPQWR